MGRAYASCKTSATPRIAVMLLLLAVAVGIPAFAQPATKASVEARTAAVERILADYRDEQARRDPVRASLEGDRRYSDQLSDFSASAENSRVERGQTYIQRLSEIDNAGLPVKTRAAATTLLNRLIDEQSAEQGQSWRMPLEQFSGLHTQLLDLAQKLPFTAVKDYDDYRTRLTRVPGAFSQIMTNIQLGAEVSRTLPPAGVEKVLAETKFMAAQSAEASPFAAPLKRFPATIPAGDRQRITTDLLETITIDVIPSYQRVARFVAARASAAPAR